MFVVYSKENCPFCVKAVKALDFMEKQYVKYDIEKDKGACEIFKQGGFKTVPQIYHNDEYIGGYEELADYLLELT